MWSFLAFAVRFAPVAVNSPPNARVSKFVMSDSFFVPSIDEAERWLESFWGVTNGPHSDSAELLCTAPAPAEVLWLATRGDSSAAAAAVKLLRNCPTEDRRPSTLPRGLELAIVLRRCL